MNSVTTRVAALGLCFALATAGYPPVGEQPPPAPVTQRPKFERLLEFAWRERFFPAPPGAYGQFGLSDAQRAGIQEALARAEKEATPLQRAVAKLRKEIQGGDAETERETVPKIRRLNEELGGVYASAKAQIDRLPTPEQRAAATRLAAEARRAEAERAAFLAGLDARTDGALTAARADVASRLLLSPSQKGQVAEVVDRLREQEARLPAGPDARAPAEERTRLRAAARAQVERLLTPGQQILLQTLRAATRDDRRILARGNGSHQPVAFAPDGRALASVNPDTDFSGPVWKNAQVVRLWDPATGDLLGALRRPQEHYVGVTAVAFSPSGGLLGCGDQSGAVRLWAVSARREAAMKEAAVLPSPAGGVRSVAFSPDGKTLATVGPDKTVWLWDVATRGEVAVLRGHAAPVARVAFSPDGKSLAALSLDVVPPDPAWRGCYQVKLWDPATGRERANSPIHVAATGLSLAFSPDGAALVVGLVLTDVATGRPRATLRVRSVDGFSVWSAAFAPDGRTLAAGGPNGVVLWELAGEEVPAPPSP